MNCDNISNDTDNQTNNNNTDDARGETARACSECAGKQLRAGPPVTDRTACHFIRTIYISPSTYSFVRNYNVDLNPKRYYEGLVTPVYLKIILMAQVITYSK